MHLWEIAELDLFKVNFLSKDSLGLNCVQCFFLFLFFLSLPLRYCFKIWRFSGPFAFEGWSVFLLTLHSVHDWTDVFTKSAQAFSKTTQIFEEGPMQGSLPTWICLRFCTLTCLPSPCYASVYVCSYHCFQRAGLSGHLLVYLHLNSLLAQP